MAGVDLGVKPYRVQLSRKKGWRMPPNTVKVSRPSPFGNPFRVGEEGVSNNAHAVRLFKKLLADYNKDLANDDELFYFTEERIRAYLRGKNLACWCKLTDECHADVLLELANK